MTTAEYERVREEEREARRKQRHLERMRKGADSARQREWRARLAAALADTSKVRCRCGLHRGMTRAELQQLGAGCGAPAFVCPRLDTIRRRLGC